MGLFISSMPAMTKPQLATGPQKWIVSGPTGERIKPIRLKLLDILRFILIPKSYFLSFDILF